MPAAITAPAPIRELSMTTAASPNTQSSATVQACTNAKRPTVMFRPIFVGYMPSAICTVALSKNWQLFPISIKLPSPRNATQGAKETFSPKETRPTNVAPFPNSAAVHLGTVPLNEITTGLEAALIEYPYMTGVSR